MRFAQLWRWEGTINQKEYATLGCTALVLKHLLDKSVAGEVFHRPWMPWSYWMPLGPQARVGQLQDDERWFAATLLMIAIPFIWLGVTLTVQRLRDAGKPLWLVILFFIPVINILFFLMLCTLGSHARAPRQQAMPWPETRGLDVWIPRSPIGAGFVAIGATVIIGLLFAALSTQTLKSYGWGLFVALPFCLGLFSVLVYSYHEPRSFRSCLAVSLVLIGLLVAVLLVVAIEGLICLLMAAPFALGLAGLGGAVGYAIQSGYWRNRDAPAVLSVVLLFTPAFLGVEHWVKPTPEAFVVKTAIEVNASPEAVWKRVVAFSEIAPPKEMLFRAGIAYPIRAEIAGKGPGAVRNCIFSTGPFVEPIEVWDEPRLLRFDVTSNPAPMQEWTPYAHIEPPHLHGYFVSEKGQFLLTPLAGGRARLEGTTWYRHTMWPAGYWHLWSDYIIHHIHLRVLNHIRDEVERSGVGHSGSG